MMPPGMDAQFARGVGTVTHGVAKRVTGNGPTSCDRFSRFNSGLWHCERKRPGDAANIPDHGSTSRKG